MLTSLYRIRVSTGFRSEFQLLLFDFDLLLATIIQSLSLSYIFISLLSSSSSSISRVIALVFRFFLDFPFDNVIVGEADQ
jgi:hypothetical protein